jgi:hypothetical protein
MKTIKSSLLVVALTVISANSAWAAESLVLYDDFNAKLINPDKWFGRTSGTSGNELLETVREIKGNRLHLLSRSYGRTDNNNGGSLSQVQLFFTNPNTIAIKATIQVKDYELVGCGTSDTNSRVRVRIVGSFFNSANPTPDSFENDVWAQVRLQRSANSTDAPNVLKISSDIFRCTDATCSGSETISTADVGTAKVGEKVTLRLEWDQASKRFIAQRNNEEEVSLFYTVSDTQLPSVKFRRIDAHQFIANCTTQPRPAGFVDAYLDNVFVNQ